MLSGWRKTSKSSFGTMCVFSWGIFGETPEREIRSVQQPDGFVKAAVCQLEAVTRVDDPRECLEPLLPEQAVVEAAFGDPDHGLGLGDAPPLER